MSCGSECFERRTQDNGLFDADMTIYQGLFHSLHWAQPQTTFGTSITKIQGSAACIYILNHLFARHLSSVQ